MVLLCPDAACETTAPHIDNPKAPQPGKPNPLATLSVTAATAMTTACGGGSTDLGTSDTKVTPPPVISKPEAARFLLQASLSASDTDIQFVVSKGKEAWINQQAGLTSSISRVNWLINSGFSDGKYITGGGLENVLWRHLIAEPNNFVQRMTIFWTEFFVVSVLGLPVSWKQFMVANYVDTLESHALGNFRELLKAVTLSPGMGEYLSLVGSQKSDPATNRHPDENYAREVMQLFTIGLYQLNTDGSPKLDASGQPVATYTQDDVTNLAAALTGWKFVGDRFSYDYAVTPMYMANSFHQTDTSSFLGVTIPSGTTGEQSLEIILDTLFNHPNTAPFVATRMIKHFVSANPSSQYIQRVVQVFMNNGKGVRGDMLAVAKAVLLDAEACQSVQSSTGKVREPMLRFTQWARTFGVNTDTGVWNIGITSDPSTRLGQSPLRAPSVFGFFDPTYTPPNSPLSQQNLLAPEMQLIDENSVAGYLNFLQFFVTNGIGDLKTAYSTEVGLAATSSALLDRLNTLLTAGQLSTSTLNAIASALDSMPYVTSTDLLNRVKAAVFLVMASPDYLVMR